MFQSDTYLCMAFPVPTSQDAYIGEYIFLKVFIVDSHVGHPTPWPEGTKWRGRAGWYRQGMHWAKVCTVSEVGVPPLMHSFPSSSALAIEFSVSANNILAWQPLKTTARTQWHK